MNEWTIGDQAQLISLAKTNVSVEEMHEYFPDLSTGAIAVKLVALRRQKLLPKDYKIRIKKWDEKRLISLAMQGLTTAENITANTRYNNNNNRWPLKHIKE